MTTARSPEILTGMDAICSKFKVSYRTVQKWERAGAPIVRDERSHVRTETGDLWDWIKSQDPVKSS